MAKMAKDSVEQDAAIIVSTFYLQAHMAMMAKDSVERGRSGNCIYILFAGTYG